MFVRSIIGKIARLSLTGLVALVFTVAMLPGTTAYAASTVRATTTVNVRSGPSTNASIVDVLSPGDTFSVVDSVAGEEVLPGNVTWFHTARGNYVYSGYTTATSGGGTVSRAGMSGRWIEVDRGEQVAKAIQNGQVVRTAPVTVGTPAFPTPIGNFRVLRRVANETMDSASIGIPRSSPNGYFLRNVLYTQYITNDGVALHYNYWSPPSAFGNYPGSHGCIGLRLGDAQFFWNFAGAGTPVIITN